MVQFRGFLGHKLSLLLRPEGQASTKERYPDLNHADLSWGVVDSGAAMLRIMATVPLDVDWNSARKMPNYDKA